jgi:D,D-heptose 1,7-bisphosphate phosphatase
MSNKAIFLDRDDTLIEDAGYIDNPDQVKLLDGAAEALRELKEMGYKLVVATNQSGVARGIVTEEVLDEIHNRLKQSLAERGAFLDQIYYCPYHPDGVIPKYRKESDRRKPNPGMLLTAAEEMDIDLGQSWCIGNSSRDVEAGLRAGCKTILINHPSHHKQPEFNAPAPDYRAVNIKEAVNIIKHYRRSLAEVSTKAQASSTYEAEPHPEPAEAGAQITEPVLQAVEAAPQIAEPAPQTAEPAPQTVEPAPQTVEPAPELVEPAPQAEEQLSEPEHAGPQSASLEEETDSEKTMQLLSAILEQIRRMQRTEMFGADFSITRLLAGVVQIGALFCLLLTVWFLMGPAPQNSSIQITLGFATVLQIMALTLYVIQGRK